ncbi:hypothetical protein ACFQ7M_40200 [Streptomyces massasporeus]
MRTPRSSPAKATPIERCSAREINTALPEPPTTARVTYPEARVLAAQAMRQEAARVALERAINAANQKIATLRRI